MHKTLFAALLATAALTPPAQAEALRLCTGAESGNYYQAGRDIAARAKGRLDVEVVPTAGSLDNLDRLVSGACDAAVVQSDALYVYARRKPGTRLALEQSADLYEEKLHLICNKEAGLSKVTKLVPTQRVAIGAPGGGTNITWEAFRLADKKRYEAIPTDPYGGARALSRIGTMASEGTSRATCMAYVTGLRAPSMQEADEWAKNNPGKIVLVPADDSDLPGVKDDFGKPLYTRTAIPAGTYPNLQPKGFFGGSDEVPTLGVRAALVTSTAFIEAKSEAYDRFLSAVGQATPSIRQRVGQ